MAVGKQKAPESKSPRIIQRKKGAPAVKQPAALGNITVRERNSPDHPPSLLVFTLIVLYKNLYILGITLLRRRLRYARRLRQSWLQFKLDCRAAMHRAGEWLVLMRDRLWRRARSPFEQIRNTRRELRPMIRERRRRHEPVLHLYLDMALPVLRLISKCVFTIINYAAPVAAAVFLIVTLESNSKVVMGLRVEYNGVQLGYVQNEVQFDEAIQEVRSRMIGSTSDTAGYISGTPHFVLEEVRPTQFTSVSTLADEIIKSHGGEIEQAYGLYIDGEFYGAVAEGDSLLDQLDAIRAQNLTGKPDEDIEFEKSIKLDLAFYPRDSVVPLESLSSLLGSYETVEQTYVVEADDSPSLISDKTGVALTRLLEMNPQIEEELHVGDEIKTAVARPFLSVRNIYTDVYEEEYEVEGEDIETISYAIGYREVTQEAESGVREVTARVTAVNGLIVDSQVVDTRVIKEAVPEKAIVGINNPRASTPPPQTETETSGGNSQTKPPDAQVGSGIRFMWPCNGGYINGGLGSYWGHTGVDIVGPGAGSPIYASASGVVTISKRTWVGYGHYIMIDHGNGLQTLYAHNSELYVNVGDTVTQGQVIALMGRTGNATGNHLHFEVRQNGRIMDPKIYIGG